MRYSIIHGEQLAFKIACDVTWRLLELALATFHWKELATPRKTDGASHKPYTHTHTHTPEAQSKDIQRRLSYHWWPDEPNYVQTFTVVTINQHKSACSPRYREALEIQGCCMYMCKINEIKIKQNTKTVKIPLIKIHKNKPLLNLSKDRQKVFRTGKDCSATPRPAIVLLLLFALATARAATQSHSL